MALDWNKIVPSGEVKQVLQEAVYDEAGNYLHTKTVIVTAEAPK